MIPLPATATKEEDANFCQRSFDHPLYLLLNIAVGGTWSGEQHGIAGKSWSEIKDW